MTGVPRGRPTSPEALEKVAKNLEVQRTHGAYEWMRRGIAPVPGCSQCIFSTECEHFEKDQKHCRAVLELQDEIYSQISGLNYITETDKYIVDRFVKNFCQLLIIEKWIASVGPFKVTEKGLTIQPVMDYRNGIERLVLRQADALGIGPLARARLNLTNVQSFCFAEALQRAKPIRNETAKLVIPEEDESDNE